MGNRRTINSSLRQRKATNRKIWLSQSPGTRKSRIDRINNHRRYEKSPVRQNRVEKNRSRQSKRRRAFSRIMSKQEMQRLINKCIDDKLKVKLQTLTADDMARLSTGNGGSGDGAVGGGNAAGSEDGVVSGGGVDGDGGGNVHGGGVGSGLGGVSGGYGGGYGNIGGDGLSGITGGYKKEIGGGNTNKRRLSHW